MEPPAINCYKAPRCIYAIAASLALSSHTRYKAKVKVHSYYSYPTNVCMTTAELSHILCYVFVVGQLLLWSDALVSACEALPHHLGPVPAIGIGLDAPWGKQRQIAMPRLCANVEVEFEIVPKPYVVDICEGYILSSAHLSVMGCQERVTINRLSSIFTTYRDISPQIYSLLSLFSTLVSPHAMIRICQIDITDSANPMMAHRAYVRRTKTRGVYL